MEKGILDPRLHRVSSTAIIHKNGKYLIVKRSPKVKAFPVQWTVPGGGLEVEDYINTPKTTSDSWYFGVINSLKREIREEVNLEIKDLRYLVDIIFIRPDKIPVIVLSYFCQWKSSKVKLSDEHTDYAWVDCKEAKKYNLISGILEEIELADKILKGEKIDENNMIEKFKKRYGV
ncbi:MAG: NUDIX domain-containing protein [Patescibacteria group bacterium]